MKGTIDLSNTESIGYASFYKCSNLDCAINLSGAKNIDGYAFTNCSKITGLILGDNVEYVGEYAFLGCSSCTGIVWPVSLSSVGDYAFSNMSALKNIYYAGSYNEWSNISFLNGTYYLFNSTKTYNYFVPSIGASKNADGSVVVNYAGVPCGEKLYVAEYKDGRFAGIREYVLAESVTVDAPSDNEVKIKFFVFDALSALCPKVKAFSL